MAVAAVGSGVGRQHLCSMQPFGLKPCQSILQPEVIYLLGGLVAKLLQSLGSEPWQLSLAISKDLSGSCNEMRL